MKKKLDKIIGVKALIKTACGLQLKPQIQKSFGHLVLLLDQFLGCGIGDIYDINVLNGTTFILNY